MKDSKGRGVIRIGDKTSHGGTVISASAGFVVLGKAVAIEGDAVQCPACKGVFKIKVDDSERRHHGKLVAYANDQTACGAVLVSSL